MLKNIRAWDKVNKEMKAICEISNMDSFVTLDNGVGLYELRIPEESELIKGSALKDLKDIEI